MRNHRVWQLISSINICCFFTSVFILMQIPILYWHIFSVVSGEQVWDIIPSARCQSWSNTYHTTVTTIFHAFTKGTLILLRMLMTTLQTQMLKSNRDIFTIYKVKSFKLERKRVILIQIVIKNILFNNTVTNQFKTDRHLAVMIAVPGFRTIPQNAKQ